jgi:hypothetical protein
MSYELYLLCVFNFKKICIRLFFQLSFVTLVFYCEHTFLKQSICQRKICEFYIEVNKTCSFLLNKLLKLCLFIPIMSLSWS